MQLKHALMIGSVWLAGTSVAQAGWVIEQVSVASNAKGVASPAEPASMRVSQGRIRLTQPSAITVQDCVKGRFGLLVPERNTYWSGTIDEYVGELYSQPSAHNPRKLLSADREVKADPPPKIDEATLPKIVIRKTEEQEKIAGYDTQKYLIESNGKLFQEVWLTTAINLNDDLDPKSYAACRAKLSTGMRGASAQDFNALYLSPEYLEFAKSGLALKTITHHIAGSHSLEVRSVSRADVPSSDFELPSTAKKVPLAEVFGPPVGR
ncbi:MAG: DUF4412 domain-containing protein [Deltaproteobacteria bacterium]|nr:DUF4412 domain-containing protein [Deltaproteobacteria bacterium]